MKRLFAAFVLCFCIGTMFFNIENNSLKHRYEKSSQQVKLQNIKILQASAAELWCDQTTNETCTINFGGIVGNSFGILRASN